jgi:predicted ATPase
MKGLLKSSRWTLRNNIIVKSNFMDKLQKNIFVITGGPASGKTTLLNGLRKRGFKCFDEIARQIIDEQLKIKGDLVPWINLDKFNVHVLERMVNQHAKVTEELHFFDRGLPDNIAYMRLGNLPVGKDFHETAKNLRYNKKVFFLEPWKEIFVNDAARKEPFEFALKISEHIKNAYVDFGYEVIVVPKGTVEERVEFVVRQIKE